jgi:hypothetical protein
MPQVLVANESWNTRVDKFGRSSHCQIEAAELPCNHAGIYSVSFIHLFAIMP